MRGEYTLHKEPVIREAFPCHHAVLGVYRPLPHIYICNPWAPCQIRKIAGCACVGNAGNVFPRRRLQRKLLVSDPGMHHGTCVTHVPWCMSGLLNQRRRRKHSRHSRHMRTRNLTNLVRGPLCLISNPVCCSWKHPTCVVVWQKVIASPGQSDTLDKSQSQRNPLHIYSYYSSLRMDSLKVRNLNNIYHFHNHSHHFSIWHFDTLNMEKVFFVKNVWRQNIVGRCSEQNGKYCLWLNLHECWNVLIG